MLRRVFLAIIALGLFVASCGTVRQWPEESEWIEMIEAYNETAEEKDNIICEKRKPIGSNLPRWYCGTVAYWETVERLRQMGNVTPEVTAVYILHSSD